MTAPHRIGRVDDWAGFAAREHVFALVDEIGAGWPYGYAPGEQAPASGWFDAMAREGDVHVASGDREQVLGYCLALRLTAYPNLATLAERLVPAPSTTMYLAELGVVPDARGQQLGRRIVELALAAAPSDTTHWLVRTLANNEPAISLYRGLGFHLLDVRQIHRQRERVFLVRDWIDDAGN